MYVQPDDVVAEIGAQCREVSTVLCQSLMASQEGKGTGQAVLVDVTRDAPQNTADDKRTRAMRMPGTEKEFFPNVATFIEMDHLDQWRTVLRQHANNYDVLVLDLNTVVGNDLDFTALALVHEFAALFPTHRLVLIKSAALQHWATRLVPASTLLRRPLVPKEEQVHKATETRLSLSSDPVIVGTVGVAEYRRTIKHVVHPGDTVLEVGCHLGTTTVLLQEQATGYGERGSISNGLYDSNNSTSAATVWGVDVGPKIVARAQKRYPHVNFAVGNAWKTAQLQRLLWSEVGEGNTKTKSMNSQQPKTFDVVYVDVGGLSGPDGWLEALALLSSLGYALEPRCIVIKSLCIRRLCTRLLPYWQLRQGQKSSSEG